MLSNFHTHTPQKRQKETKDTQQFVLLSCTVVPQFRRMQKLPLAAPCQDRRHRSLTHRPHCTVERKMSDKTY